MGSARGAELVSLDFEVHARNLWYGKGQGGGTPWVILLAREVVKESTGFSPKDLVIWHSVHGPLAVLQKENLEDHVNGFRRHLYGAVDVARKNLESAQTNQKKTVQLQSTI